MCGSTNSLLADISILTFLIPLLTKIKLNCAFHLDDATAKLYTS